MSFLDGLICMKFLYSLLSKLTMYDSVHTDSFSILNIAFMIEYNNFTNEVEQKKIHLNTSKLYQYVVCSRKVILLFCVILPV